MGRPDQNPGVSHAQPAPGPIGIPSQLPITGAASNRPSKWTSELFDCMNDGENGLHEMIGPLLTLVGKYLKLGSDICGTSGMLYGVI
ncbi:unnamed protein product [Brassica oleracea]